MNWLACSLLALLPLIGFSADTTEQQKSAGHSAVCPLHKLALVEKTVPIIYGMAEMRPEWDPSVRGKFFPYAREAVFGGCVVMKEKTSSVLLCAECKKAEGKWKQNWDTQRRRAATRLE